MAHIALYRKYRSQTFEDVRGQQHITRTLQNAIRLGKIAHAYLFCGPRGTGKTTTARLLAKALNCESGTTPTPCDRCAMCVAIREGRAVDVIEMDAASETGIDDVRETIIENAQYMPQQARYKVYIIDEVHDLSAKAFDALLKTLEEPPPHVVFVLATTEVQRVPVTIRSRCIRFDFRRAIQEDLILLVNAVLEQEGLSADPEAVQAIARAADGSFRDALSLLEQVVAYAGGHIDWETVRSVLGIVDEEAIGAVINAAARGDVARALMAADEMLRRGSSVRTILEAIAQRVRDLLYAQMGAIGEDLPHAQLAALKAQAQHFTPEKLSQILEALIRAQAQLKNVPQQRIVLDLAMMQVASIKGKSADAGEGGASSAGKTVTVQPSITLPQEQVERIDHPKRFDSASTPRTSDELKPSAEGSVAPAAPTTASASSDELLKLVQGRWLQIVDKLAERSRGGAEVLRDASPVRVEDGKVLVLEFKSEFAYSQMQSEKRRQFVEQTISSVLGGRKVSLRCELSRGGANRATANPQEQAKITPEDVDGEQYAREVAATFDGYVEPEGG